MALLNQLNTLETSGLIRLATVQPELEYLFRHALVQDAAYGSLLKNDRRRLHKNVGESLEQLYPDRLDEIASTLAYHFEKADERDKAIHYFTLAGDRARAGYANNEAIQFYQATLAQIAIEVTENRSAEQCQLHEYLGELLNLIGQRETAREHFAKAIALAAGNVIGQARLHRKMALSFVEQRIFPEAEHHFAEGEKALLHAPAEDAEWKHEMIQNRIDQLWMFYAQNLPDKVEQLIEQVRPLLDTHGNAAQKARFYFGLAQIQLRRRRYSVTEEMLSSMYLGVQAADASDDPHIRAETHFGYGFLLLWHGSLGEAEKELAQAIQFSERTGNVTILARSLTYLVILHRVRKDRQKLQELLPQLKRVLATSRLHEYQPYINAINLWFAWHEGRFDEVHKLAAEAFAIWQQSPFVNPFHWVIRWPLLSVAVQQGNFSEAIEQAKEMLMPTQQKLPDDVTAALETAIQCEPASAREPLEHALRLASQKGYL